MTLPLIAHQIIAHRSPFAGVRIEVECAPRIGQIERLAIDRGRAF